MGNTRGIYTHATTLSLGEILTVSAVPTGTGWTATSAVVAVLVLADASDDSGRLIWGLVAHIQQGPLAVNTRNRFVVPILGPQFTLVRGSCDAPFKADIDLIFIEICLAFGVTARDKVVQAFRPCIGRVVEGIGFLDDRWRRNVGADDGSPDARLLAGNRWRRPTQIGHLHRRRIVCTTSSTRRHQGRNASSSSSVVEPLLVLVLRLIGHHIFLVLLLLPFAHLVALVERLLIWMLLWQRLLLLLVLLLLWQLLRRNPIRQRVALLNQRTDTLRLLVDIEPNGSELTWRLFESSRPMVPILLLLLVWRAKK